MLKPPLGISVHVFWVNFWWSFIFNWTLNNSIFHLTFNFPKKWGKCDDCQNAKNSNLARLTWKLCFPRDRAPSSGPVGYFQWWQGWRRIFTTLSWLEKPRNQNTPFTKHSGCGRLYCIHLLWLWLLSRKITHVDHLLVCSVDTFVSNVTVKELTVPCTQLLTGLDITCCDYLHLCQVPEPKDTSLYP